MWMGLLFARLWCFRKATIGDMWPFLFGLFIVDISLGSVVCFLFSLVTTFLFIARSFVMVLGEHGCCGMWVCGCSG
jgi:hypothetical protein